MEFRAIVAAAAMAAAFLSSCADPAPDAAEVRPSLVLEFGPGGGRPEQSLAVFMRTESEPRRAESMLVASLDDPAGCRWLVERPRSFVSSDGERFAYASGIRPRGGFPVPSGRYELVYAVSSGEEVRAEFVVPEAGALLDADAGSAASLVPGGTENVAVYDDAGILVFLGKPRPEWSDDGELLKEFPKAARRRRVVVSEGESVVCLLPFEDVVRPEPPAELPE